VPLIPSLIRKYEEVLKSLSMLPRQHNYENAPLEKISNITYN
jgi:hypothetical protein